MFFFTLACVLALAPALVHAARLFDDAGPGTREDRIYYTGHWQHVRGQHDVRLFGTSSRSSHVGDQAQIRFAGTRLRLYGVVGPAGGFCYISVDGSRAKRVSFYAFRVRGRALVYTTPRLASREHSLAIVVMGERPALSYGHFVNIDAFEVDGPYPLVAAARTTQSIDTVEWQTVLGAAAAVIVIAALLALGLSRRRAARLRRAR